MTTPPEDETPPSTTLEDFDITEVIARARAEAEASPPIDGEDGPEEDSGELSDDTDDVEEDGDDSDEEPAEDDEAEESEEDEPEVAEETSPPVEPQPAKAPQAEVDPLRAEVEQLRRSNAQLLEILGQQQRQQVAAQQQQPKAPDIPPEVMKLVLFGGDTSGVDPSQVERAKRAAQDYLERESRYAVNPALRYQEIRAAVLADLQQTIGPVLQEHYDQRAKAEMAKHKDLLDDPPTKARLSAVFQSTPGWDSPDFATKQRAFEIAATQVRVEKKQAEIAEAERRVKAAEAQQKANRKAKQKASGLGKAARRTAPGNKRPAFRPETDPLEYYNTLLAGD